MISPLLSSPGFQKATRAPAGSHNLIAVDGWQVALNGRMQWMNSRIHGLGRCTGWKTDVLKSGLGWKESRVEKFHVLKGCIDWGGHVLKTFMGWMGKWVKGIHGKKLCIGWKDSWVERVHALKAYMGCKIHVLQGCQSLGLGYHSCLPVSSCLCTKIGIPSLSVSLVIFVYWD